MYDICRGCENYKITRDDSGELTGHECLIYPDCIKVEKLEIK